MDFIYYYKKSYIFGLQKNSQQNPQTQYKYKRRQLSSQLRVVAIAAASRAIFYLLFLNLICREKHLDQLEPEVEGNTLSLSSLSSLFGANFVSLHLMFNLFLFLLIVINMFQIRVSLMVCLEVWRGRRVVERRVKGNSYPLPCLDVFKISKGEESNQPFLLFGCFKNQDGEKRK